MSTKIIITCDICREEFSTGKWIDEHFEGGGIGLVFRSVKSGDVTFGNPSDTNGTHICNPCAQALHQELKKYFK